MEDAQFNALLREKFLKITNFIEDPQFLQIGANDGKLAENLFDTFMSTDWRGILMEPIPYYFAKLEQTYASKPKFKLINAALAPYDGYADIRRIPPDTIKDDELWAHGVSSIDGTRSSFTENSSVPNEVALGLHARSILERIETITFDTLRTNTKIDRIDYLQIDTEGYDLHVMKQIDLLRYRPFLIDCEIYNLSLSDRGEMYSLLQKFGYKIIVSKWDLMAYLF